MPQPKKSTSSRGGARKVPRARAATAAREAPDPEPSEAETAAAVDGTANGLRDQLSRLLNPLDAVVLTRDLLQEVVDDAVTRGRLTRADATELMMEILAIGRRATEDVWSEVDQLLGGPADRMRREMDRARRATGIGASFPISGYENLSAAQVQARLAELTPAELRKVRDFE